MSTPLEKIDASIAGVAACIPDTVLTNHDLVRTMDTTDEWIQAMTGIRERHIVDSTQAASDLGVVAAERALIRAGIAGADIDLIIVGPASSSGIGPVPSCCSRFHQVAVSYRPVLALMGQGSSTSICRPEGPVWL